MISRLLVSLCAFALAACAGTSAGSTTTQVPTATEPSTTVTSLPVGVEERAPFEGAVVTVAGPAESQTLLSFPEVFAAFSEVTGASIRYVSPEDPIAEVLGGSEVDLVVTSGIRDLVLLADEGQLRDLPVAIDADSLAAAMLDGVADYLTINDAIVAVPFEIVPKSLLWYAAADPPIDDVVARDSIDDLIAATDAISPGTATWCLGVESGPSTGWVLTDWLEDLLLRTAGPEVYRSFVTGELPFTSDEVHAAARLMASLLSSDGAVRGGLENASSVSILTAASAMAETPAGCWLTHQASFQLAFFDVSGITPDGVVGVMRTPGPTADDALMIASVSSIALVSDTPAAAALIEHLTDPASAIDRFGAGWVFSPWTGMDASEYPDRALTRTIAELTAGSTLFPDASDSYPEVLEDAFRRELVAWVNGTQTLDTSLEEIEAVRRAAVD